MPGKFSETYLSDALAALDDKFRSPNEINKRVGYNSPHSTGEALRALAVMGRCEAQQELLIVRLGFRWMYRRAP